MLGWIILGIIIFILLWILFITRRRDDDYTDLESRLNRVKLSWDDVCAKIKKLWGC